jgi:hypothetical protein
MEKKSKIFTVGVREAYKFNKNEVAKVLSVMIVNLKLSRPLHFSTLRKLKLSQAQLYQSKDAIM